MHTIKFKISEGNQLEALSSIRTRRQAEGEQPNFTNQCQNQVNQLKI